MNFAEVEIDKRYACEWEGHHYFATTLHKQEGLVLVKLSDRINADGEPDSPVLLRKRPLAPRLLVLDVDLPLLALDLRKEQDRQLLLSIRRSPAPRISL